MPRGKTQATATVAEPTTEDALMPEQFDENKAEAEAVAMAEADAKPKPKRKATPNHVEVTLDMPLAVYYLLSQRLLSKTGVILRQIPGVTDATGDYAIISETDTEVTVADTISDHLRARANQTITNLSEQRAQRLAQKRSAEAGIQNYRERLERDKADAERQASPFPAHIEEAIEKNIRDYQASAENYGKMIDALDAQLAEAQAELAAVPERKTWIARLPV